MSFVGLGVLGLAGLSWAAEPRLDVSAWVPTASPVALTAGGLCEDREDDVLGVAVVVYGRRRGRSRWGHISLRFLACTDGLLRDVEFEASRMDRTTPDWFAAAFPDEGWYESADFERIQRDRLVLFRNDDPVDSGAYYDQLTRNRDVVELWMPWHGAPAAEALAELDAHYDAQVAALRAEQPISRPRYRALACNCTHPVLQTAEMVSAGGRWPDSLFPLAWQRRLVSDPDVDVVVHPSSHLLARIEQTQGDLKGAWSGAPVWVPAPWVRGSLNDAQLEAYRARIFDTAESVGMRIVLDRLEDGRR